MTSTLILILLLGLVYLYIFSFAIYFHKTADKVFNPAQKRINSILIWVVPIIWIIIIKAIMKSTTRAPSKKFDSSSVNSDNYNWANAWIFFLHDSNRSSHSEQDSIEHYGHGHDYNNHGGDGRHDSTDSH